MTPPPFFANMEAGSINVSGLGMDRDEVQRISGRILRGIGWEGQMRYD